MKQLSIVDLYGNSKEVTNLAKAIQQAEEAIDFLSNHSQIKFPQALKEWEHDYKQLLNLEKSLK